MSSLASAGSRSVKLVRPAYPEPEIVDRGDEPELSELLHPLIDVLDDLERRSLGDLEDDPVGDSREGRGGVEELVVVEVRGVQVHEELEIARRVRRFLGDTSTDQPAKVVQSSETLRGVENLGGARKARLAQSQQRLVAEDRPVLPVHDRLVGHPEPLQGAREAGLEARPIAQRLGRDPRQLHGLALQARQPVQSNGALHGLVERLRAPPA